MNPVLIGSKQVAECNSFKGIDSSNKDNLPLMFPHESVDNRIGIWCDYLSMCGNKLEMEADDTLLFFPHVFSLRRDYQSDPLYGFSWNKSLKTYEKNGKGMLGLPMEDHVYLQVLHSFSGENDHLVLDGIEHGIDWIRNQILTNQSMKVIRTDLFQIYWAKDTDTRKFLADECISVASKFVSCLNEVKAGTRDKWNIMELATHVYEWMQTNTSQKRMKYSVKDAVLDLSLTFPEFINAESFLEAGTGCRRGLYQIFGEWPKTKEIQERMFKQIMEHSSYPLQHNHISRMEAQVCYGFKCLAHKTGLLDMAGRSKPEKLVLLGEPCPDHKSHYENTDKQHENKMECFFE